MENGEGTLMDPVAKRMWILKVGSRNVSQLVSLALP